MENINISAPLFKRHQLGDRKLRSVRRYKRPRYRAGKSDVFDYIEGFYNRVRRHSHLDLLSPLAFEQLRTGS